MYKTVSITRCPTCPLTINTVGQFSRVEIDEIVDAGYLTGLFVLARTAGLIGHAMEQKRLGQPLYRHPWEDVLYM